MIEVKKEADEAYDRGYQFCQEDKLDDALREVNEAIKLEPEFSYAYHFRSVILLGMNKFAEAFADNKKLFALNDIEESRRLPILISNKFKEIFENNGWKVFQRLSVNKELFPFILIGDKHVIVTADAPSLAGWTEENCPDQIQNLLDARSGVLRFYKLMAKNNPPPLKVTAALIVFAGDYPSPDVIKMAKEKLDLTIVNSGSFCGNNIPGVENLEKFITDMGQQPEIDSELLDQIALSVVGIVDANDDDSDEEDSSDGSGDNSGKTISEI